MVYVIIDFTRFNNRTLNRREPRTMIFSRVPVVGELIQIDAELFLVREVTHFPVTDPAHYGVFEPHARVEV